MKKLLLTKWMLLLCALVVGSGSVWAEDENIATATFNGKNATYTSGWSTTGTGLSRTDCVIIGSGENVTSPAFDLSKYSKVTITFTGRRYGSLSGSKATVDVAVGGSSKGTIDFTASSVGAVSGSIQFEPTSSMTSAVLVFTCTNATSAGSTHGAGIGSITIMGTLKVKKTLKSISLSGSQPTEFHVGDTFSSEGLVVTAHYVEDGVADKVVTPTSVSSPNMATAGVKTVTVSYTEDEVTKTDTYDITVIPVPVAPVGPAVGSGYVLVTDASTLADGDQIIIVGDDVAMSTTQNSNNRGEEAVTISSNTISSISSNVQVITLEGATDEWYFNVGTGYLYAASSSSNHLKTSSKSTVGDNGKATIEINSTTGVATVLFQGSNSRNYMQYNSSSSIFSCYAPDKPQSDIYIYRQVEATTFDVTIGPAGWRTLVTSKNVTLPFGVTAYIVTGSTTSSATLTPINQINKNTPVLLEGTEGNYTLTVTEDAYTYPGDNLLQISTDATENDVYVLAKKTKGVGFYKWNGGRLGAGRVYLAPSAGARDFLAFSDDETTGINNVNVNHNDNCYDLQGRRVAQPTKGLYIVNGKKVIFK